MTDKRQKRPQIIGAPEIGVILPKTSALTEKWTTVHWNERESTKKQKQLGFFVDDFKCDLWALSEEQPKSMTWVMFVKRCDYTFSLAKCHVRRFQMPKTRLFSSSLGSFES